MIKHVFLFRFIYSTEVTNMFMHTFLLVFIAEMADKTQLMVMALTNRYRARTVAFGMILGVLTISGLSVLAGDIIGDFIPMQIVQTVAALLFLFFGLSSLRAEDESGGSQGVNYRFPLISIAGAFLLAELGDKTQLATVAIAAHHQEHFAIFLGAAAGLILANILGIFAGKIIFSHLRENTVKVASAGFFFLFGSINLFETIPFSFPIIVGYSIVLMTTAYIVYSRSRRSLR